MASNSAAIAALPPLHENPGAGQQYAFDDLYVGTRYQHHAYGLPADIPEVIAAIASPSKSGGGSSQNPPAPKKPRTRSRNPLKPNWRDKTYAKPTMGGGSGEHHLLGAHYALTEGDAEARHRHRHPDERCAMGVARRHTHSHPLTHIT